MNKKILITACLMACVVGNVAEARMAATAATEFTNPVGVRQILDALTVIRPTDGIFRRAFGIGGFGRINDPVFSLDDTDVKDASFLKINSASNFSSYTGVPPDFYGTAMLFAFPSGGASTRGPTINYIGPVGTYVICGLMNAAGNILRPTYEVAAGVYTQVKLPSIAAGGGAVIYSDEDIFDAVGATEVVAPTNGFFLLCHAYQAVSGRLQAAELSPNTLSATW